MNLKEIIKSVRRIELKAKSFSNQNFSGLDRSASKGLGMNFSEVREYQLGDETRFIDWNVTARYNNPHVKVFEEEREHVNMFFIDVSGSVDFGGGERTKKRVIIELFATMAFSCSMNQDKIGAVFFSDEVVKYFIPKKGKKHVWTMLKYLIENEFKSKSSDPSSAFDFFQKTKWKKYRLFLFSDLLFSDPMQSISALKKTKSKNQAFVIRVYDELENRLPIKGFYQLINSETGLRTWVNGFSTNVQNSMRKTNEKNELLWKDECKRGKILLTSISTQSDIYSKLNGFF